MSAKPALRPEAANIFRRLDEAGLKQRDLAVAIGLEDNKISKVKAGDRQFQAPEVLKAHQWLDDVERQARSNVSSETLPTRDASENDGPVQLRVLDLDLAMGEGNNLDDYVEEGTMDFDAGVLRRITRTPAERLYLARGSGDSMLPTLMNGDMVLIDPLQTRLNLDDRIWAISLYGAGAIKRLQPVGPGKVEVISDNPARNNRVVDADDIRILGRVIWVGREV